MKNSERGAVVYLSYSKYGTNKTKVAQNTDDYTGGTYTESSIYSSSTYYNQSTTLNAYGVYDLNGGGAEYTASYVNTGSDNLREYGGELFEVSPNSSTKYKTVYPVNRVDTHISNYKETQGVKGDSIWEVSADEAWMNDTWEESSSQYREEDWPFFFVGCGCDYKETSMFCYGKNYVVYGQRWPSFASLLGVLSEIGVGAGRKTM